MCWKIRRRLSFALKKKKKKKRNWSFTSNRYYHWLAKTQWFWMAAEIPRLVAYFFPSLWKRVRVASSIKERKRKKRKKKNKKKKKAPIVSQTRATDQRMEYLAWGRSVASECKRGRTKRRELWLASNNDISANRKSYRDKTKSVLKGTIFFI